MDYIVHGCKELDTTDYFHLMTNLLKKGLHHCLAYVSLLHWQRSRHAKDALSMTAC